MRLAGDRPAALFFHGLARVCLRVRADEGLGYVLGSSEASDNPFDDISYTPASSIAVSDRRAGGGRHALSIFYLLPTYIPW